MRTACRKRYPAAYTKVAPDSIATRTKHRQRAVYARTLIPSHEAAKRQLRRGRKMVATEFRTKTASWRSSIASSLTPTSLSLSATNGDELSRKTTNAPAVATARKNTEKARSFIHSDREVTISTHGSYSSVLHMSIPTLPIFQKSPKARTRVRPA